MTVALVAADVADEASGLISTGMASPAPVAAGGSTHEPRILDDLVRPLRIFKTLSTITASIPSSTCC